MPPRDGSISYQKFSQNSTALPCPVSADHFIYHKTNMVFIFFAWFKYNVCIFSVKFFQLHKLLEDLNELVVEVQIEVKYVNLRWGLFLKCLTRWLFVIFNIIEVQTLTVDHHSLHHFMQLCTIVDGLKQKRWYSPGSLVFRLIWFQPR